MDIRNVVRAYYNAACVEQSGIVKDQRMKDIMQGRVEFDNNFVTSWMVNYGLFQGLNGKQRVAIVNSINANLAGLHKTNPILISDDHIIDRFRILYTELYLTVNRSWLSATSKLLWCVYPDDVAIYDSFVERTIIVMQWLDADLSKLPRLGNVPNLKSSDDIPNMVSYYNNYQNMIKVLFNKSKPAFNQLRNEYNELYPHDIRIFDKILWIIGNRKTV